MKQLLCVLLGLAMVLLGAPSMAHAADRLEADHQFGPGDPNYLGPLIVNPSSGMVGVPSVKSLSTLAPCPFTHRAYSRIAIIGRPDTAAYDGSIQEVWPRGSDDPSLQDKPITLDGSILINGGALSNPYAVVGGRYPLLLTCESFVPRSSYLPLTDDVKYFLAVITMDSEYTWKASWGEPPSKPDDPGSQPDGVDVNVAVPVATSAPASGLSLSVPPESVTLTGMGDGTRVEGVPWYASGKIDKVTVTDDRRQAGVDWTLTGQASDFVSEGDNTIAASNLSWTPLYVDGPQNMPMDRGKPKESLDTARLFASSPGKPEPNLISTVRADFLLEVPPEVKGGAYKSTLTLILV